MTKDLFSRRSLTLSGTLAVLLVGLAASPALANTSSVDTSACAAPQLSQPFLSVKDTNWYTLTPGESVDSFDGSGWTLTGGANIKTVRLANGQTTSVLDLPSGSKAVSPTICVDSGFQTARTMVRNVVGAEGVFFYVSYAGTNTWNNPKNTGQVHGQHTDWTLSDPVTVQPSGIAGWQLVRFTFVPGGNSSDFQVYDFYVDPRMRG
jgi:hypothetical protein